MQEAIENGRKVWKLVCGAALVLNLDRFIAAGCDEVYLDLVDAYWCWRRIMTVIPAPAP